MELSNTKIDRHVIIAWNSNPDVIREIESTFGEDIILKREIKLTPKERFEKINKLYDPIHVPHNSARCNYSEPLTLFVVQMEPKYKYYLRTEGYLLCNSTILDFKIRNRKKFHFELFHCSDSIEETKKALKVFELEEFIPGCAIVNTENIYSIRHLSDGYIEIHKLRDDVTAQHLIGYSIEYLNKKYNLLTVEDNHHVVKSDCLESLELLPDFNQEHSVYKVEAYKYADNYHVITDGKHRASLLHFRGNRHLFLMESPAPCTTEDLLAAARTTETVSHVDNLHRVIYSLNNNNIRFIVIRGYKTMPKTADTDLDVVIHPNDYEKFLKVMESHLKDGTLFFNVEKPYKHEPVSWYRAYRTSGVYNDFLTNKGYQLDTYSTVFFFGPDENAVVLSNNFIEHLFKNKIPFYNLYIPDALSEMVLLFCRTYIDLGGNWKVKHKNRFDELKQSGITKEQFVEHLKLSLDNNQSQLINYADDLFV